MSAARAIALHPDRLLPADPGTRAVARRLYQAVRDLPILSPHGHIDTATLLDDEPLPDPTALFITPDHYVTRLLRASGVALDERIYSSARQGDATDGELLAFRRHMLFEMARMSTEDGLVMTLRPAVRRGHHAPTAARFGPDTGHDIPIAVEFTDAMRPLLDRFGTHPGLHLVLCTIDEKLFSREIAPLAGFYPSVFADAPWWFIDAPDAITRYGAAVTETAGFSRTSGFIDDTRALCSLPARHDMSRRLDSGYLARLVAEHRLDEDEALETVVELVTGNPRRVFKV
jgi:glucuronate isomerase